MNGKWLSGDGDSEGVFVDNGGRVGIGTTSTSYPLNVTGSLRFTISGINSSSSGVGVYGGNNSSGNYGFLGTGIYGAYGRHNSSGNSGSLGNSGSGVHGEGGAYGVSGTGDNGVYGFTYSSGTGVLGESGSGYGVYGKHNSSSNYGYLGSSGYGVYGYSSNVGVYGKNSSSGNYGYLGSGGRGVSGYSTSGYGVAGTSASGYAGYFSGNVHITGRLSKTSGTFVQPHAQNPAKEIQYAFFEGPEHAVFLRGTAEIKDGTAVIDLPEYFSIVAAEEGVQVQVTPVEDCNGIFVKSQGREMVEVKELMGGKHNARFNYFITAVRKGFEAHEPVVDNTHFKPEEGEMAGEFEARFSRDDMTTLAMKSMLISNGILTADGKLDMAMVETLGWTFAEKDDDKGGDKFADKELYLSKSE